MSFPVVPVLVLGGQKGPPLPTHPLNSSPATPGVAVARRLLVGSFVPEESRMRAACAAPAPSSEHAARAAAKGRRRKRREPFRAAETDSAFATVFLMRSSLSKT